MSTTQAPAPARSTHPVHVGHLVMGLAFLGLVAIWAAVQSDLVPTEDIRWLLPLPWVFAGVAGLLAVLLSGRRRASEPTPPRAEPPTIQTPVDPEADVTVGAEDHDPTEEIR